MTAVTRISTPYEHRLELVQGVVTQKTALDDEASRELSVSILQVLDRIPERIR